MIEEKTPFYKKILFKISAVLGFLSLIFALLSDSYNIYEKITGKPRDTIIIPIKTVYDTIVSTREIEKVNENNFTVINNYYGNVGKLEVNFTLKWTKTDEVEGYYFYDKRPTIKYFIKGNNYKKGSLYLEEYTENELTAKISLEKKIESGLLKWSGKMFNTDGRILDVEIFKMK